MNLKQLLKNRIALGVIILFAVYFFFLFYFKEYKSLWWDGASYIGMGKYIFTNGGQGVFEPMKSIFLPIFLGLFWKLGLNVILFGKFFIFIFALVSLIFIYFIAKEFFEEKVGLIAVIILFFNILFFLFIFRIYTEVLSICFILGSLLFMIKFSKTDRTLFLSLSALFSVFAFYSKYPNLFIIGLLNLYLLFYSYYKRKISPFLYYNLFLIIFLFPFLLVNFIYFGDPIYFVNLSQEYFKENLGSLYSLKTFPGIPKLIFENTDFIYVKALLFLFNLTLPFAIYGAYKIIKDEKDVFFEEKLFLLVMPCAFILLFFEIFYLKQERYILPAFPLIALFASYGLSFIKVKWKYFIIAIYIIIFLVGSFLVFNLHAQDNNYASFFMKPPINFSCKDVATSDPLSVLNYNLIFPYEVYSEDWTGGEVIKKKPECVFYYSCALNIEEHIKILKGLNYSVGYEKPWGKCLYAVFKR